MEGQTIILTAEGKETLQQRIGKAELKIMQLTQSVERAIQLYGLHDEQYAERLELKLDAEAELSILKDMLSRAQIIEAPLDKGKVSIGSKVVLSGEEAVKEFQIVDSYEADPLKGKVSTVSPLGKSLLGRKLGEMVRLISPNGVVNYTISAII